MEYILKSGFNRMLLDLGVFCSKYVASNFDIQRAKSQLNKLIQQCTVNSVAIETMRMPHMKWDTKQTNVTELMLQIGIDSIEIGKRINCKNVIIQPLFAELSKSNEWDCNREYYIKLGRQAQKNDICILLENQCRNINGHLTRGACSDVIAAAEWIDVLNKELGSEAFGFCFDAGAGNLCGQDMGEVAVILGERLKAVILRECDGINEASRIPFTGMGRNGSNTDWLSLIRGLRKIEFEGELILDVCDTLRGFSPLLRPQLYGVAKSVADFFQWQIEIEKRLKKYTSRVLFGAGKMCQNYMKCYGELYPPLFTCDNNSKLWGSSVYGLEVKSPESLKELSSDCAVVICNTFYQEIAKQLRDMGITNIETFNDEYLPFLLAEIEE